MFSFNKFKIEYEYWMFSIYFWFFLVNFFRYWNFFFYLYSLIWKLFRSLLYNGSRIIFGTNNWSCTGIWKFQHFGEALGPLSKEKDKLLCDYNDLKEKFEHEQEKQLQVCSNFRQEMKALQGLASKIKEYVMSIVYKIDDSFPLVKWLSFHAGIILRRKEIDWRNCLKSKIAQNLSFETVSPDCRSYQNNWPKARIQRWMKTIWGATLRITWIIGKPRLMSIGLLVKLNHWKRKCWKLVVSLVLRQRL